MLTQTARTIVMALVSKLPPNILKELLDKGLDWLEEEIVKTDTKLDDAVVITLIKALRAQLGIEEKPGSPYVDQPVDGT